MTYGGLALGLLLLPLGGCYVPPTQPTDYAQPGYPPGTPYGYAQPGYPPDYAQPGYPPPGYPPSGYPPPGYDPYGNVYPGYSDNGGNPTLLVAGAAVPLVLFGGGWGYWDTHHNWHSAPDAVQRHLVQQQAAGGFHAVPGGTPQPRPQGRPPPAAGGQTFFHANTPPPAAPGGGQTFFHANTPPPPAAPNGQTFFHGTEQPHPGPAAASRPAPPAPPPHEEHGHGCPPGQRC